MRTRFAYGNAAWSGGTTQKRGNAFKRGRKAPFSARRRNTRGRKRLLKKRRFWRAETGLCRHVARDDRFANANGRSDHFVCRRQRARRRFFPYHGARERVSRIYAVERCGRCFRGGAYSFSLTNAIRARDSRKRKRRFDGRQFAGGASGERDCGSCDITRYFTWLRRKDTRAGQGTD